MCNTDNMKGSSKTVVRKRRGRPATGQDPVTAIRLSAELRESVDEWAARQDDEPGRSEAIRRLVERALTIAAKTVQVDANDLKATLSLLDAYAKKEGRGAHFKDNDQKLPDGYYAVRVQRLRDALAAPRKAKAR
jgi:hypothetical protein